MKNMDYYKEAASLMSEGFDRHAPGKYQFSPANLRRIMADIDIKEHNGLDGLRVSDMQLIAKIYEKGPVSVKIIAAGLEWEQEEVIEHIEDLEEYKLLICKSGDYEISKEGSLAVEMVANKMLEEDRLWLKQRLDLVEKILDSAPPI